MKTQLSQWASALALAFTLTWPVAAAPRIELVAGGPEDKVGIPALQAKLKEPFGTEFDRAGTMFIVEMIAGNRLLKVDAKGVLTHVAGQLKAGDSGDGGPALAAQFNGPHNLAVLPDGNVLIGDTWNGRVRKVDLKVGTVRKRRAMGRIASRSIRPATPSTSRTSSACRNSISKLANSRSSRATDRKANPPMARRPRKRRSLIRARWRWIPRATFTFSNAAATRSAS
jgi:hypothetical protein